MQPTRSHTALHAGLIVVLLVLAGFTFASVRTFEFVDYDDPIYVGNWDESQVVGEGLSLGGLKWIWTANAASLWEPLSYLSHMIDVELFGNEPDSARGHHVTNLWLHCLNAALVYWLVFRLSGRAGVAFFAAAMFALHPLRAESVAWVSERKGLLCACFVLLALDSYVEFALRRKRIWLYASVVFTGLGMMSKPVAVVIPALIGLLDVWPLKRCGFDDEPLRPQAIITRQLTEKWPHLLMAGTLAVVSILAQYGSHEEKFIGAFPLWQRLGFAPAGIVFYLQRTVWPADLTFEYPYPDSKLFSFAGFLVVGAISWWLIRNRKSYRPLLFGWIWFLICWLPVSGLAYVGASFTTDRYMYLPHIGLFCGLAWQLSEWCWGDRTLQYVAAAAGVVVLLLLMPVAGRQVESWKSNLTLFQHAIIARPEVATGYTNLATTLERQGDAELAIPLLEKALQLQPSYTGYYNLARLYSRDPERKADAEEMYRLTIEINPRYARAWHNLALMELRKGSLDEALYLVKQANELEDYSNSLFLNSLAEVHLHRKEFDQALSVCRRALSGPIDQDRVRQALQKKMEILKAGTNPVTP